MSPCPAILAETTAGASLDDPILLVALGVGIAALVYFLVMRRSARAAGSAPKSSTGPQRVDDAASRQLEGLLDELERVAGAMSARFESQTARLEALIREADERARNLESALAASRAGDLAGRIMKEGTSDQDCGLAALARHREIYELADAGQSAPRIAQKLRRPEGEVELILALRGRGGIS